MTNYKILTCCGIFNQISTPLILSESKTCGNYRKYNCLDHYHLVENEHKVLCATNVVAFHSAIRGSNFARIINA